MKIPVPDIPVVNNPMQILCIKYAVISLWYPVVAANLRTREPPMVRSIFL